MTDDLHIFRTMRPVVSGPSTALRSKERRLLLAAISPSPRLRFATLRPVGALLAAAAVFAAAIFIVTGSGPGGDSAWAASAVKIAQSAPRLLVASDGWRVTRADQFGGDAGELTFASDTQQAELRWEPAGNYASTIADFNTSADKVATASVLGASAQIYHYADTDLYTAVWVADSHALQLEASSSDVAMIESVLAQLRFVSVNTWLSALPSSVVLSGARNEVVRSMLADVPLPQGVERSRFTEGDAVRDRYQLGAQIVSSVSCGWIAQWIAAKRQGNAPEVAEAVKAMTAVAGSRVLRQMDSSGAYPTVVREFAGAMAHGGNVVGPYAIGDQSVEDSYRSSLGCR